MYYLYLHSTNSQNRPRQLYFGCLQESSSGGGETSLCDFRKVYNELDPELRQKFEDKGVLYNRTHPKVGARWTFDVGSMLSWRQMFGTSDKTEVESIAQKEGEAPVQWIGPNKDTFFQSWKDDATQLHPVTKEKVWFNHAQVFHCQPFQPNFGMRLHVSMTLNSYSALSLLASWPSSNTICLVIAWPWIFALVMIPLLRYLK